MEFTLYVKLILIWSKQGLRSTPLYKSRNQNIERCPTTLPGNVVITLRSDALPTALEAVLADGSRSLADTGGSSAA